MAVGSGVNVSVGVKVGDGGMVAVNVTVGVDVKVGAGMGVNVARICPGRQAMSQSIVNTNVFLSFIGCHYIG